jgi:hypothetical protein
MKERDFRTDSCGWQQVVAPAAIFQGITAHVLQAYTHHQLHLAWQDLQ